MKLTVTGDEAREIVWCESEYWLEIEYRVVGTSRWSIHYEGIFQYLPEPVVALENTYYKFKWSTGANEKPFRDEKEVTPVEVRKVTKTVGVWEEINA